MHQTAVARSYSCYLPTSSPLRFRRANHRTANENAPKSLEGDGHRTDAVDEVARHVTRVARLERGQLREQFTEDRPQLSPRHVCAQAEVPPAAPEPEVRIGRAAQVETFGRVEH